MARGAPRLAGRKTQLAGSRKRSPIARVDKHVDAVDGEKAKADGNKFTHGFCGVALTPVLPPDVIPNLHLAAP